MERIFSWSGTVFMIWNGRFPGTDRNESAPSNRPESEWPPSQYGLRVRTSFESERPLSDDGLWVKTTFEPERPFVVSYN